MSDLMTQIEEHNKKKMEAETEKTITRVKFLVECVKNALKKEGATIRETNMMNQFLAHDLKKSLDRVMEPHVKNANDTFLKDVL